MELSPSHTSLDELRAEIEASQWTVVSWAADRHDSIDYALCRISDGRHVVVSLQLTPKEDLLHYFSTVGCRIQQEGSRQFVLPPVPSRNRLPSTGLMGCYAMQSRTGIILLTGR